MYHNTFDLVHSASHYLVTVVTLYTSLVASFNKTLCTFHTGAIAINGSVFTGSMSTAFVSSVACIGDEIDLFSCSLNLSSMVCGGEAKAGVACQGL